MRVGVIECPHCAATVSAKASLVYVSRAVPKLWDRWLDDVSDTKVYKSSVSALIRPAIAS